MVVVSWRLTCWTTILVILSSPRPHHPSEVAMSSWMMMVGAEGAMTGGSGTNDPDVYPPGPAIKKWRLNTNFGNVDNWEGLRGHENCSRNIYSFPTWYDEEFVVSWPKVFTGKQIILPVNAHFVFGEGEHTFLNAAGDGGVGHGQEATCEGREVEFVRRSTSDWFDPDNWAHHQQDTHEGSETNAPASSSAIPHVERVPCQYDSAKFRGNSSFNLKISSNVTITKFYLGDQELAKSDLAALMNSSLGKLQFQMAPETRFSIVGEGDPPPGKNEDSGCSVKDGDSDRCICSNYKDRNLKQKICSFAKCTDQEDNCPNPITPHGFCCSICGFHVKLRHSGNLKVHPVYTKLKNEISRAKLEGMIHAYVTRYKEKGAHIVILPRPQHLRDLSIRRKLLGLVRRVEAFLKQESEVIGVTLTESWGRAAGDGGSIDRLEGSGLGGGLITLIVFLVLVVLLGGIALFIFMWNRKHGYPPLTLSSVTSALPRMSSMRIPIVPGGGSGGRRSSTLSNSLHSFGFARFTNERMSTVTISPGESSEGGSSSAGGGTAGAGKGKPAKSSSIMIADKVDDEQLPIAEEDEKVTDANSGAYGFTNVTYDLVAGVENEEKKETEVGVTEKKGDFPILTIPEVTVVEIPEENSKVETTGKVNEVKGVTLKGRPPAPLPTPSSEPSTSSVKEEKPAGKIGKPSFVASRLAKAYQKLGTDKEQEDKKRGEEPKKAKKKGKKTEGTFKAKRLEEDDESDDDTTAVAPIQEEREKEEADITPALTIDEQPGDSPSSAPPQEAKEGELVNLE